MLWSFCCGPSALVLLFRLCFLRTRSCCSQHRRYLLLAVSLLVCGLHSTSKIKGAYPLRSDTTRGIAISVLPRLFVIHFSQSVFRTKNYSTIEKPASDSCERQRLSIGLLPSCCCLLRSGCIITANFLLWVGLGSRGNSKNVRRTRKKK